MATELVWFEVVDLTSYGVKYPKDWYYRCGHKPKMWENSVCESLGCYSSEEKAIDCLRKWAKEKGIDFEKNSKRQDYLYGYYENAYSIECKPVIQVGLYYNHNDEQVTIDENFDYLTAALVVRKTMTLDED